MLTEDVIWLVYGGGVRISHYVHIWLSCDDLFICLICDVGHGLSPSFAFVKWSQYILHWCLDSTLIIFNYWSIIYLNKKGFYTPYLNILEVILVYFLDPDTSQFPLPNLV